MVFSFSIHPYSCIMAWQWPEFRVKTSCHVIKLFIVCVLVVIKNTDKYYEIPVTKIQNNLRKHKNIKVSFLIKALFRDAKYIKLLKESLTPQHGWVAGHPHHQFEGNQLNMKKQQSNVSHLYERALTQWS